MVPLDFKTVAVRRYWICDQHGTRELQSVEKIYDVFCLSVILILKLRDPSAFSPVPNVE